MKKLSTKQMKGLKGGADPKGGGCPTDITCCYNEVLPSGLVLAVLTTCTTDSYGRCVCGPDACPIP